MADLFYDDEFQALRRTIEDGKGYKATALHLWPGMKPDSAYAKLKVCCRDDGDERLKFREYLAAMVFNAQYDVLYFACDETGHERPKPRAPADQAAELQRAFIESVAEQRRIAERIERLTRAPLQTVFKGSSSS